MNFCEVFNSTSSLSNDLQRKNKRFGKCSLEFPIFTKLQKSSVTPIVCNHIDPHKLLLKFEKNTSNQRVDRLISFVSDSKVFIIETEN